MVFRWLRDARYNEVLMDLKRLKNDIAIVEGVVQHLNDTVEAQQRQIDAFRRRIKMKKDEDDENPQGDIESEMQRVISAFGGDVPIEFRNHFKQKN